MSAFGMFSGTLRSPSMSSENANSLLGMSDSSASARRTIWVRTTSPKVPMWGSPDGP